MMVAGYTCRDLQIARLEQDPPQSSQETVFDYVANGLSGAMNFNDSEIVASILFEKGYGTTSNAEDANLILINTYLLYSR